jgi:hypothetical protein
MLAVPEQLKSVTHPLISSMYLKKDYGAIRDGEDVLVIETNFDGSHDSSLMELLGDLPTLQLLAEQKVGAFDRVDIRAASVN